MFDFMQYTAFTLLSNGVTWAEVFGFITGIICVYLGAIRNPHCFMFGFASVSLFGSIFIQKGLVSDALLQFVFLGLALTGWKEWYFSSRKQKDHKVPIKEFLSTDIVSVLLIDFLAAFMVFWMFIFYTDTNSLLFVNIMLFGLSVIAQILMNRRFIENWYVWILIDVISIPLYIYHGLYFVAIMYSLFLMLCVYGLIEWKKELNKPQLLLEDYIT